MKRASSAKTVSGAAGGAADVVPDAAETAAGQGRPRALRGEDINDLALRFIREFERRLPAGAAGAGAGLTRQGLAYLLAKGKTVTLPVWVDWCAARQKSPSGLLAELMACGTRSAGRGSSFRA